MSWYLVPLPIKALMAFLSLSLWPGSKEFTFRLTLLLPGEQPLLLDSSTGEVVVVVVTGVVVVYGK